MSSNSDSAPITGQQIAAFFVAAAETLKPFVSNEAIHINCTYLAIGAIKSDPIFAIQIGGQPVATNPDFSAAMRTALAYIDPQKLKSEAAKLRAQADALDEHVESVTPAPVEAAPQ